MSDKDDRINPPNREQRTVFIPDPGGRRSGGASPAGARPPLSTPASGRPAASPFPAASGPVNEDWIKSQQEAQNPNLPDRPAFSIEELVVQNENPIMQAAGPLLLMLGRLRVAILQAPFASLMEQVAEAIVYFDKAIRTAGIPAEQANTAKYILCATADDIVQNIPTDDRHVWTQHSMLSRFFGERIGGVRFFEELDRAKMDPINNYSLLELMFASLALGFQGVNRTSPNGQANLQRIQRDLYEILRRVRPRVDRDLSPRWLGQALPHDITRLRVPLWAIFGIATLFLFGSFLVLRMLLTDKTEIAATQLAELHGQGEMQIEHRIFAPRPIPPPPPVERLTQLQRIRLELAPEIKAGKVDATQTASKIVITVGDLVLFPSGQATVKPDFAPIAQRISKTLEKEPGTITINGYTDNVKLNVVSRFASNWQLSVERAKAVVAVLKPGLSHGERIEANGRGEENPVASNATPEGRAKNRRVEILLARSD